MNQGPGTPLKRAPGHESIKDSSSKNTDSNVELRTQKTSTCEFGQFGNGGSLDSHTPGFFILVHQKTMISWQGEAWDPESVSQPCPGIKISRRISFSCAIQGHCTTINISRICYSGAKKVQGSDRYSQLGRQQVGAESQPANTPASQ